MGEDLQSIKQNVYEHLLEKEKAYIERLTVLIEQFLRPLKERRLLNNNEVASLFGNLEEIFKVHVDFYEKLSNKDGVQLIQVFKETVPKLKVYDEYANNFKIALDTYAIVESEKSSGGAKAFNWIKEQVQNTTMIDLNLMLASPLQHVSHYSEILEPYFEKITAESPDYRAAVEFNSILQQASLYVQNSLSKTASQADLLAWERRLISKDGPVQLVKAGRKLLKEVNITQVLQEKGFFSTGSKKPRTALIFNDIIFIITRRHYKIQVTIPITGHTTIEDTLTHGERVFKIETDDNVVHFTLNTEEERMSFTKMVKELIEFKKHSRTYGVDLDVVLKRTPEKPIPEFLEKLLEYVEKEANIKEKGIFKEPGVPRDTFKIKHEIDYGKIVFLDLSQFNVHCTCSAIKQYFRELPIGLFPPALCQKLLDTFRKSGPGDAIIEAILADLPAPRFAILRRLLQTLHKVLDNSEHNQMKIEDLAVEFSTLLGSEETTNITDIALNTADRCGIFEVILKSSLHIISA